MRSGFLLLFKTHILGARYKLYLYTLIPAKLIYIYCIIVVFMKTVPTPLKGRDSIFITASKI